MTRVLQIAGFLMLIAAGALSVHTARQWRRAMPAGRSVSDRPLAERVQEAKALNQNKSQDATPPLIKQAAAFALYLNPPAPPAPKPVPPPQARVQPVQHPAAAAPWFRLLATSHYRARPEQSLALISEPGKGDRWVRQGERVGHFVFERIGEGTVVYRDGAQSREMALAPKAATPLARRRSDKVLAAQVAPRPAGRMTGSPSNEPPARSRSIPPEIDPGPE